MEGKVTMIRKVNSIINYLLFNLARPLENITEYKNAIKLELPSSMNNLILLLRNS